MARGTVKWFNSQKGYGFIQCRRAVAAKMCFVHISCCRERAGLNGLNEGQIVPNMKKSRTRWKNIGKKIFKVQFADRSNPGARLKMLTFDASRDYCFSFQVRHR